MSGSTSYASTALTDAEKVDARRFCGYQAAGSTASSFTGWRFFQAAGLLEYRLTNMAPAELQVFRQYMAQLYTMEAAIPSAADNLDTDQAAVWFHNKNELDDRSRLFDGWRRRLCDFIGIPPGQALKSSSFDVVI